MVIENYNGFTIEQDRNTHFFTASRFGTIRQSKTLEGIKGAVDDFLTQWNRLLNRFNVNEDESN